MANMANMANSAGYTETSKGSIRVFGGAEKKVVYLGADLLGEYNVKVQIFSFTKRFHDLSYGERDWILDKLQPQQQIYVKDLR
jgi:hypothetical protein